MVKLTKTDVPTILRDNAARWTRAVLEKLAASLELAKSEKSKYNHPDIKNALRIETNRKCAYCESKFGHVTYGDIEHIVPKSANPELWFDWDNLTLACDVCNTNKDDVEDLVDPYLSDPEDKFVFVGSGVWPMPGDEVSDITVRQLKLNRDELVGKRRERIEYLMRFADSISKTRDLNLKAVLQQDFQLELEDSKEYAALSRTLARELAAKGIVGV